MSSELRWFKPSYNGTQGGDCVEVAFAHRKSSYSSGGGSSGRNCAEVVVCPDTVHIGDSKDITGPQLAFSPKAWAVFVANRGRA